METKVYIFQSFPGFDLQFLCFGFFCTVSLPLQRKERRSIKEKGK